MQSSMRALMDREVAKYSSSVNEAEESSSQSGSRRYAPLRGLFSRVGFIAQ